MLRKSLGILAPFLLRRWHAAWEVSAPAVRPAIRVCGETGMKFRYKVLLGTAAVAVASAASFPNEFGLEPEQLASTRGAVGLPAGQLDLRALPRQRPRELLQPHAHRRSACAPGCGAGTTAARAIGAGHPADAAAADPRLELRGVAAVDRDRRAGHEIGGGRGEKHGDAGQVVRARPSGRPGCGRAPAR